MELLQKVTLYDLLGYALPGGVVVGLCGWHGIFGEIKYSEFPLNLLFVLWFVAGYILGIIISEMTEVIKPVDLKKQGFFEDICRHYGIELDSLNRALKRAQILEDSKSMGDFKDLEKYEGYIYSIIQVDPKYNRIHNYGSGELLYKNMALAAGAAVILGIRFGVIPEMLIGMVGTFFFIKRYQRFYKRRTGYTLCWFLDKYNCKEDKEENE